MKNKYSKKNRKYKKKSKKHYGGSETTKGCPNCPANNPTLDELSWNNRYVFGKNTASGWGCNKGGKKKSKKNIYKKIDELLRNYYKNKFALND